MLGPFGVPGAEGCILCSCLRYLAPLGGGGGGGMRQCSDNKKMGCGTDCFGCAIGLVGVSPAHWCMSLWAV